MLFGLHKSLNYLSQFAACLFSKFIRFHLDIIIHFIVSSLDLKSGACAVAPLYQVIPYIITGIIHRWLSIRVPTSYDPIEISL